MFIVCQNAFCHFVNKVLLLCYCACKAAPTISGDDAETEVAATVGERVVLRCDASGLPRPEVTWLKEGVAVERDSTVQRTGGSLQLSAVTMDDSGLYECIASNDAGTARRQVVLSVQGTWRSLVPLTCVVVVVLVVVVVVVVSRVVIQSIECNRVFL